jgi:hypothetical protein
MRAEEQEPSSRKLLNFITKFKLTDYTGPALQQALTVVHYFMKIVIAEFFILIVGFAYGQKATVYNPYAGVPIDKDSTGLSALWHCNQPPCIDSERIALQWWGDEGKPHQGLVFHRCHSWFPSGNYYLSLPFEVTAQQFDSLIALINKFPKGKDWESGIFLQYEFVIVNQEKLLNVVPIFKKDELVLLAINTLAIFEGSPMFPQLRSTWLAILQRFSLNLPNSAQH